MRTDALLQETAGALVANKVRTGLTILGIVIGISAVIVLVALGTGAQASIQAQIQSIGSNLLTVMPGSSQSTPGSRVSGGRGSATTLTVADGQAIAQLPGVAAVDEAVQSRQQLVVPGANTNASVIGTTPPYATIHEITMAEGSFFTAAQDIRASKVVVLGSAVRDDLFGADATGVVGKTVRISGQTFTVAGVAASKGGSGFNSPDNNTYIPLTTMQRYLTSQTYVGTIDVQAASADVMTQVQDDITNLLLERHKISNPELADFSVFNQADLVAAVSSVTQTFTLLLGSVAGISLLVGGIGIMNMMLTTVTERTREIGLRKAIGAKRRDINTQFLVEAIALTLAGGVIGVALGWGISFAVSSLGFVQAQVSLTSVLVAFGVSAAIGIVFGYYPARRASKLNPIDALRYE